MENNINDWTITEQNTVSEFGSSLTDANKLEDEIKAKFPISDHPTKGNTYNVNENTPKN